MNGYDDDELHDLAGAYALNAVDDVERRAFERHLATCPDCRAEVASYDDAVLGLALTTPPVPPPGALKQNVLDDLPAQEPGETSTEPTTSARRSSRRWLLAAAAIVAVLAGGVAVTQPWNQPAVVATLDDAARVEVAADAQRFEGSSGAARFVVTVSDRAGRATVSSTALPAAPTGRVYQGWFIDRTDTPRSAGPITPGRTQVLKGRPGAVFAVTLEPAGGSTAPTTEPLVTVDLG